MATQLLVRLVDHKNPLLGFGALFLILAFVNTSGTSFSPTTDPSYPLGVVGLAVLVIGVALHLGERKIREKERFQDPVLHEAPFWQEVFDAMPPAFIKAHADGPAAGDLKHIAESEALKNFQGRERAGTGTPAQTDRDRDLIRGDHREGDEEAIATGGSRYLESSDTYGANPTRQIVTVKSAFDYGGRQFVVGWFVPIELPETLGRARAHRAKETGLQVTYRLTDAPGNEGIPVTIGHAARLAGRNRSRSPSQNAGST
jgi:hypothetical protein